jgi:hypothetical protein
VTSPDFANQNYQDKRFFQTVVGGQNMAPGVAWSAGPPGTQSYMLVMEGEGGLRIDPTVHWVVYDFYDIPRSGTCLPTGIPEDVYIKDPAGAIDAKTRAYSAGRSVVSRATGPLTSPPAADAGLRRNPPLRPYVGEVLEQALDLIFSDAQLYNRFRTLLQKQDKPRGEDELPEDIDEAERFRRWRSTSKYADRFVRSPRQQAV